MPGTVTETIYVRHTFSDKELSAIAQKMAASEAAISRKLEELKSMTASIKADVATQEGILHGCAEKLRSGYEMRQKEAIADYTVVGIVKFVDKDSGEVLEERPLTEDEQLRLSGKRTDAEDIIREANEEED